jgi:dienelactone hydrolase
LLPQIREFIHRNFAVLVPIRRGYGPTGGDFAEDYHSCLNPSYLEAGMESAKDILAAMRFAATLPYIQAHNILLVGQSGGGFASLATASLNPPGLKGVINFAGGRGGERDSPGEPCRPDKLKTAFSEFSKTIKVPVLWFYTQNDQFFNPEYVRDWFRTFKEDGGEGRLVITPPFSNNGHLLFPSKEGIPLWTIEFNAFVKQSIHLQP